MLSNQLSEIPSLSESAHLLSQLRPKGLLEKDILLRWLLESDPGACKSLWQQAQAVQDIHVGKEVHLRALIEIGNYCQRHCLYCGIRQPNRLLKRYRLTREKILTSAEAALNLGYKTVVLQGGEDPEVTGDWMADLIQQLKAKGDIAVTLSLGERSLEELAQWKAAGADRYLLRFETSNRALYDHIHPTAHPQRHRLRILKELHTVGYEVGSGIMIGIPGQSYEDIANDLLCFADLNLDMIGVGPYLVHPQTPLGVGASFRTLSKRDQVPATAFMTYKVLALARLMCPMANLPATTALLGCESDGGALAFQRGANVLMINFTPLPYRSYYEIYPFRGENKHAYDSQWRTEKARKDIQSIGLTCSTHKGASFNYQARSKQP